MIIGLSGYARCGKDTVAEYLVDNYGFKRVAFADGIRNALLAINPFVPNHTSLNEIVAAEGWEVAKLNPYIRQMLQNFGVHARENWSQGFWVDLAFKQFTGGKVVITDVRFPNEYDSIVATGGDIVRIMREGVAPINGHVSEIALDNHEFKHTIHNDSDLLNNNGTIEELVEKVKVILTNLKVI